MNNKRKNRAAMILLPIMLVLLALTLGAMVLYSVWEQAPQLDTKTEEETVPADNMFYGTELTAADKAGRRRGVYTVLLVGNDDGFGNTDTIIVGSMDTVNHKADFVSIPRDTYVNNGWQIRKINAVYAGTENSGGIGIEGLRKEIKNLLGFDVDCYAVVDIGVVEKAIDLIGGVEFNVPFDMDYEDADQGLSIHIKSGEQLLDGKAAMGLLRYRSGYVNGDLQRIEMQQDFLKAAVRQFVTAGSIRNFKALTELLSENMDTNMSTGNIAFFIRNALMCESEDIRFHIMPNTPGIVHEVSYTFIRLEPWLEMVNEFLDPYYKEVTADDVDIVYPDAGGFYGTCGIRGANYFN